MGCFHDFIAVSLHPACSLSEPLISLITQISMI